MTEVSNQTPEWRAVTAALSGYRVAQAPYLNALSATDIIGIAQAVLRVHPPAPSDRAQEGEPLRWLNEVALKHTGDDCLLWPFSVRPNGYGQVRSDGTTQIASRVVCQAVNGSPPSPDHQAAHSCGVRACCSPAHLRWATRLENMADMDAHGMVARGERNGHALLTESDVRVIRRRLADGDTQKAVAEDYSVSRHTISNLANRRSWAWLD